MAVSAGLQAKPAVTHYERRATGFLGRADVSLLACRLETGRTLQIRVHMQSTGFPLVGDPVYGKPHLSAVFGRQALHAGRLGLIHPVNGREYEWRVAVPDDFAALLIEAGVTDDAP
jgi:23S rRNA pseudouridine1911/1915/1917 synthase